MRQLTHLNELHEKQEANGLKLITIYAQNAPADKVKSLAKKRKIKYPIALQSDYWNVGYQATSLPMVWIIGVDGKITYISSSPKDLADNMDKEIAKAMKKVIYRGLGGTDITEALKPAATAFAARKFKEAYDLAEKISDDSDVEADVTSADAIMEKIDDQLALLTNRFESAEIEKKYYVAFAALRELKADYADFEDAKEYIEKLAELEKDEEVKKEMAGKDALVAAEMGLGVDGASKTGADYWKLAQAAYESVVKDHAATASGKFAAEQVAAWKKLIDDAAKTKK